MIPGVSFLPFDTGLTITNVANTAVSNSSSITIPSGAAAGDVCVIVNIYKNGSGTSAPGSVNPSGFLQMANMTGSAGGKGYRCLISVKILGSSDPGSSVTIGTGDGSRSYLFVFRGSSPITSGTVLYNSMAATGSDPSARTFTPTDSDLPCVVIGATWTDNAAALSFSPTGTTNNLTTFAQSAFIIYNDNPQTTTMDIGSAGNFAILVGFALKLQ